MMDRSPAVHVSVVLGVIVLLSSGCQDRRSVAAPREARVDLAYVTGEAAAHLNALGQFVLPTPTPIGPEAEISAERAQALASIVVRYYKRSSLPLFEQQRGTTIDLDALRPCGRTLYAASPFEAPPQEVDLAARKAVGSWWLVSFCAPDGQPVLSEAVAALANDLEIQGNRIVWTRNAGGGEFFTMGIPVGRTIPIAPELAVQRVAEATGRRVTKVPELIVPAAFVPPQGAVWKVTLDGPVRARSRTGGSISEMTELYVGANKDGRGNVVFYEASATHEPEVVRYPPGEDVRAPLATAPLRRRASAPRGIEAITIVSVGEVRSTRERRSDAGELPVPR